MNGAAILAWAVQTGLVVSLMIIGILLIRRPFARLFGAGAAYALWSLPLIRLCLPVISIPAAWLPARYRPRVESALMRDPQLAPNGAGPEIHTSTAVQLPTASEADIAMSVSTAPFDWTGTVLGLWIGVGAVWLTLQIVRQGVFVRRLRRTADPLSAKLQDEARSASVLTGLTRVPDILQSRENLGPLVTGVMRPIVVVPAGFEDSYTQEQRRFALVHEFAHIRRRDLWAAFAALVFRALNWVNPLVHYAVHKMRVDQEAACDAFVVARTNRSGGTTLGYAQTLLQAARTRQSGTGTAALALSLADMELEKETSNE